MGFWSDLFGDGDYRPAIERLLAEQTADGNTRAELGRDVIQAVVLARDAIIRIAPDKVERKQLQEIADAISACRARLRELSSDEGGYGFATLHELERGVRDL